MQQPHPSTPIHTSATGRRITLQLIGLDRIADLLAVTRAELDDLVAGDDFPAPFVDDVGPDTTARRLWTDLSIAVYRLRRDSTPRLVGP